MFNWCAQKLLWWNALGVYKAHAYASHFDEVETRKEVRDKIRLQDQAQEKVERSKTKICSYEKALELMILFWSM